MQDTRNDDLDVELDNDYDEDVQKNRFLTFKIAEQEYGIKISAVTEIVGMQAITEVPDVPRFVKGVINLRGTVIPVIDVRLRFGMEEREYDDRTCVIVVMVQDTVVGLVVDTVREVVAFREESISAPPNINNADGNSEYIMGLGKLEDSVSILLDVEQLVDQSAFS
ncbi:MAG: chemotaxis protein CheW [bacterium]